MLPFPLWSTKTSAMCMDAPTMAFDCNMGIINDGRFDAWNTARDPGMGMGYFNRSDLPYYYELYDHFLVGDHYFQSTYTATNPNRMHLFTGSNGLSVGNAPVLDDHEPFPGFLWETMAETLQAANISWRVYQEQDNFDDNAFAWFLKFQTAPTSSPWYQKGLYRAQSLLEEFENDLKAGTLPQVSWLVGPENCSEHATNHPAAGEDYSAQLLKIVQKYPDVYKNMVFILNYDEGGQFYDHLWTPMPPLHPPFDGVSTLSTLGETFVSSDLDNKTVPIGLGYRVPLMIISPWTRGNLLLSEVLDHTSVIQLIEQRFNVTCPNISPWRRSVVGNLANVFDFDHPNYTWPTLPPTAAYPFEADLECLLFPPPEVPAVQHFPTQETGIRTALPLPYDQHVQFTFNPNTSSVTLQLSATGNSTSSYMWFNAKDIVSVVPKRFQVEPGKKILSTMSVSSVYNYSLGLHGVNGFVRKLDGAMFPLNGESIHWDEFKHNESCMITLIANSSTIPAGKYLITDNAYGLGGPWVVPVSKHNPLHFALTFNLSSSGRWYDFTVTRFIASNTSHWWAQRFMGHVENGQRSISDPAMSQGIPSHLYGGPLRSTDDHPVLPDSVRKFKRKEGVSKDAKYYPRQRDEL